MYERIHLSFWEKSEKVQDKYNLKKKQDNVICSKYVFFCFEKSDKILSEGKSMRANVGKIGKFIFLFPDTRNIWQFFTPCTERIQNQYQYLTAVNACRKSILIQISIIDNFQCLYKINIKINQQLEIIYCF